ncbi:probable LRR receptor-like serine/threonine-protein kinase At3g47570 [Mercurialis annua]|uniref:probable LRR receptor-like serine/threonine-protein kinase At3g47570 n=1 Tax=Mercurialis annua TaxID=3986 RepID=UPI00215F43A7|nr:probable LRR receptor-like serine/threonine-protein kinase At3g47570 [Mercurialis annua]
MVFSYKILFLFCVACLRSTSFVESRNVTDLQALLEFMSKITHDPFQLLSSWNATTHFCRWQGVTCGRGRRVTVLNLQSARLSGSISPYITNLSYMKSLNLQNNSFSHEIPQQIGHLSYLEELNLSNNSLTGKIPTSISKCSNLIVIQLGYNKLQGVVPEELGALSNLQVVSMPANKLTGKIPDSLGNMSQLYELFLSDNQLVGKVPDSLGQLRKLKVLALRSNELFGTIPSSLFNISSLQHIDIAQNHFHGNLPSDFGLLLPNIRWFAIDSNEFTGKIPASFSNATNLELLSLIENNLTGEVPCLAKLHKLRAFSVSFNNLGTERADDLNFLRSLTNATALEHLGINGNSFGGVLPDTIANLSTSLRVLLLDNNRIFGSLPFDIGNLVRLEDFEMWNNQLSGFIPESIGKLQNLMVLALNNNMLSGNLPSSVGNLTSLVQFLVQNNNLSGRIPSDLGRCQNLVGLDLSENNFTGSIPSEILRISSLSTHLNLSGNNLSGNLAIEVGNLNNLRELDVSGNKLSGKIPSYLGNCISLEILKMDGNNFQGLLSSSLSSLNALRILDLSHNNLSGEIPEFLSSFGVLQFLNLSYNNFQGIMPRKGAIFQNASAISVEGNNLLCGGISEFQLRICNSRTKKTSRSTLGLKTAIAAISGIILLFFISFWKLSRQTKLKQRTDQEYFSYKNRMMELSYHTLYKATDGFSSANMIGMGGFGSVYKAWLDREKEALVAVKVFNLTRGGANKSFLAECEALRNIRHRNLVKVITACSSVDYDGDEFKALVFELMVNGSLDKWLHSKTRNLNLLQRLNIAMDVACALEYLHHHCKPQIVHCDLKSSNILVDEEMIGHVSDFGLASFILQSAQNNSTQISSMGVRGTIGYAPPEYAMGKEVSTCGDIYSYGILLLEMFTGKRPVDKMFRQGLSLHNYVKTALPDRGVEIVDPILRSEIEESETSIDGSDGEICAGRSTNRLIVCLNGILKVGIYCSVDSPIERMSILVAIRMLTSIKNELVGVIGIGIRSERQSSTSIQSKIRNIRDLL